MLFFFCLNNYTYSTYTRQDKQQLLKTYYSYQWYKYCTIKFACQIIIFALKINVLKSNLLENLKFRNSFDFRTKGRWPSMTFFTRYKSWHVHSTVGERSIARIFFKFSKCSILGINLPSLRTFRKNFLS